MTEANDSQLIENLYSKALRRLFLTGFINNLIFFSIFGIVFFDLLFITKLTNFISTWYLISILITAVLSLAIYRTIVTLPNTYYVLASIDHNVGTRGSFSLLNELLTNNKQNDLIQILSEKCSKFSHSISLHTIFPWKFTWNHYLMAAISFTVLLLIAMPNNKKNETNELMPQLAKNEKNFAIDKKDEILEKFLNNETTNLPAQTDNPTTELTKVIIQNKPSSENTTTTQNNQKNELNNNEKKQEPSTDEKADSNKAKGENSSTGSGTEEKHTDKTIAIKEELNKESNSNIKIALKDGINQDGSSERVNTQSSSNTPKSGSTIQLTSEIKSVTLNQSSNLVSTKYQKIIERYFSSED